MLILTTLLRLFALCSVLTNGASGVVEAAEAADTATGYDLEDVLKLAPFEVKGTRMEDFGFRYRGMLAFPGPSYLMVTEVLPNTPAARAGLTPGELISKIEGKSLSIFSMSKVLKMPQRKWAELEAGKKTATWSMEVHAPGTADSHTVTMVIPSPAPHWGSKKWSAPVGRMPAAVNEAGPLAALSREVLDNGIWSMPLDAPYPGAVSFFKNPILGYEWSIRQETSAHRIWVTQQRGKTQIILEHRSPETGSSLFLTSPSGAMEEAKCQAPKRPEERNEIPPEEVRARFESEINFWLTKVGRVTGRWPFEALSGEAEVTASSSNTNGEPEIVSAPLASSFLKLPVATSAQKELFLTALGKIGMDGDCCAYTETSKSIGDDHVTTVRFDPSKPPEERSTLLKVDGQVPKAAYLLQWRNEEHGAQSDLNKLPALSSIVDMNDVRVYSDETAAMVFELPVKASNSDFPAEKFQARFRVNKANRAFEDFSVKLRKPMRVAGIAKVTDAGLEAHFQTFDPALAPQLVSLKMGGSVRVLFVKVSRAFEVTRTDFERVVPFENQMKAAL